MEDNFSKFGLPTGLVALGKKLPVLAAPAKKNIPKDAVLVNNSWVLGGVVMFFTVLLLMTLTISVRQARQNAIQPELAAQLQIQHAHIANALQQALFGEAAAFTRLRDSRQQFNHDISLLLQGGSYRGTTVAVADDSLAPGLHTYFRNWQLEDQRIDLILNQQEPLIRLNNSIKAVNNAHSQLARRIDELINRMTEAGNLSQEIRTVETIKIHARTVAKNVKTLLPLESPLAEIAAQLAQDHAQVAAMIQTLSQGNHGLGAISSKHEVIQDLLSHVYAQLRKFDEHLHIIRKEIPVALTMESAIDDVVSSHAAMQEQAATLDDEIQQQNSHSALLLNTLTMILASCTATSARNTPAVLAKPWSRNPCHPPSSTAVWQHPDCLLGSLLPNTSITCRCIASRKSPPAKM